MSPARRSPRRALSSIAATPTLDIRGVVAHSFAKSEAREALDAATPDTPEAEDAARALAELMVRRLIRWPGHGDQVLVDVVRTGDEQTLRTLVQVVETYYERMCR